MTSPFTSMPSADTVAFEAGYYGLDRLAFRNGYLAGLEGDREFLTIVSPALVAAATAGYDAAVQLVGASTS